MHLSPTPRLLLLLLTSLISTPTTAQSTNTTTNQTCSWDNAAIDTNTPVNATNRLSFTWPEPNNQSAWIFSVSYNASEPRNQGTAWLSVPPDAEDEVCVFKFRAVNNTNRSDKMNGCDGIVSQQCFDALKNKRLSAGRNAVGRLPCGPLTIEGVKNACGSDLVSQGIAYPPYALDLSKHTCAVKSPPGISLPTSNARTFRVEGIASVILDLNASNETLYDQYVRQTTPWLVITKFKNGDGAASMVCIAPNVTQAGSRVPSEKFTPAASTNGALRNGGSVGIAAVVAGVFAAVLMA